ncbi:glycosyltransferase [Actinoplanes sp. NPDC089786]|uniref:glycosyltransferase family protein n=1 Tax=Actinoplanes sp. NPDC089786 TaxID=3155185 RepID=UPI0034258961
MQAAELLDDHVTAMGPSLRAAVGATAVRERSVDARHLLARAAGAGLDDLLAAARAGDRRWLRRVRPRRAMLATLAQTIALQDLRPADRADALALYTLLGPRALSAAHQGLHAQLTLVWAGPAAVPGLLRRYRRIRPEVRAAIEADLANPFVADRPVGPWLEAFGALLPAPGPILDGNTSVPPFDRLVPATPPAKIAATQPISVVIPVRRSGPELLTAIRSILGQTWPDLDVILIAAEVDPALRRAAAMGDTIRLARTREEALAVATGDFVAFQDPAGWAHPRRLERQMAPMCDPEVVATTSDGLPVTDDLLFTRAGLRTGRIEASSLLFRRSAVAGRIHHVAEPLALVRPREQPRTEARRAAYDVVLAGDWRFATGPVRSAVDEIRALRDAGMRVGIVQQDTFRAAYRRRLPLCAAIQGLVDAGVADQVGLSDACTAELLLVRQAAVLQFAADEPAQLRAGRVLVVADRAPQGHYDTRTCTARVRRVFDLTAVWWPRDPGVRAALRAADPDLPIAERDLPAIIDADGWVATRAGATADRPIAGADLCDTEAAGPIGVLGRLSDMDVRLRLADGPPGTSAPGVPTSWLIFPAGAVAPKAFLHQLDFYLHVPGPAAAGTFSRPALEAAAAGCVVVLPERSAALYGDAAIYAEPEAVPDLIRRYAADPALFAEQSRRARQVVAKAHRPEQFALTVEGCR